MKSCFWMSNSSGCINGSFLFLVAFLQLSHCERPQALVPLVASTPTRQIEPLVYSAVVSGWRNCKSQSRR